VKLFLTAISSTRPRASSSRAPSNPAETLAADYLARASHYLPCEAVTHPSEATFLTWLDRLSARTAPHLILLDPRGKQLSSEDIAAHIARLRDSGLQTLVLAIGPADGWSAEARSRANLLLSFGPITLPHSLARVVLAEQLYRALTILANHPYHSAH
jgi:23S rRNA (pseudouridine1915-N3)-methyltransferase